MRTKKIHWGIADVTFVQNQSIITLGPKINICNKKNASIPISEKFLKYTLAQLQYIYFFNMTKENEIHGGMDEISSV